MFEKVKKKIPQIISLFFIDDLRFIIENKIDDIVVILQKVSEVVIKWGIYNAISFDVEKIEIVLFTIVRKNSLIKIAENNKLNIGGKEIKFSVNVIK